MGFLDSIERGARQQPARKPNDSASAQQRVICKRQIRKAADASQPQGETAIAPPVAPIVPDPMADYRAALGAIDAPAPVVPQVPIGPARQLTAQASPLTTRQAMREERRAYRHRFAAANGATPGSPNYAERAALFDAQADRIDARYSEHDTPAQRMPMMQPTAPVPSSTPAPAQLPTPAGSRNAQRVADTLTCDCKPYVDVLTPNRWHAQGRRIRDAEWPNPIPATVIVERPDKRSGHRGKTRRFRRQTRLYCRCQTEPQAPANLPQQQAPAIAR